MVYFYLFSVTSAPVFGFVGWKQDMDSCIEISLKFYIEEGWTRNKGAPLFHISMETKPSWVLVCQAYWPVRAAIVSSRRMPSGGFYSTDQFIWQHVLGVTVTISPPATLCFVVQHKGTLLKVNCLHGRFAGRIVLLCPIATVPLNRLKWDVTPISVTLQRSLPTKL